MVELSGYPICYLDEIDPESDNTYIFTTCDIAREWQNPKARIILWFLEWDKNYHQRPGVAETWVSNREYAKLIGAKYVPLGSHPGLGERRTGDEYDLAHLSYYLGIHRREMVYNQLMERGIKIAPNGWDEERQRILMNSKAMLNVHQRWEYPAIAPLRVALAAAYHLPVISEAGWDSAPYSETILETDYDHLVGFAEAMVKAALNLQDFGDGLHQLLCEDLRFDKVVEANL